jgi:hypothetical protein
MAAVSSYVSIVGSLASLPNGNGLRISSILFPICTSAEARTRDLNAGTGHKMDSYHRHFHGEFE